MEGIEGDEVGVLDPVVTGDLRDCPFAATTTVNLDDPRRRRLRHGPQVVRSGRGDPDRGGGASPATDAGRSAFAQVDPPSAVQRMVPGPVFTASALDGEKSVLKRCTGAGGSNSKPFASKSARIAG